MKQRRRIYYTETQKALKWERGTAAARPAVPYAGIATTMNRRTAAWDNGNAEGDRNGEKTEPARSDGYGTHDTDIGDWLPRR